MRGSKLIRILFVSLGDNLYGTETFIMDLINNLPKDKYKCYWGIPYESRLTDILKEFKIDYFNFRNNSLNGFKINGIIQISRFILQNNIDIIHSNSGIIPCIIGKLLCVRKCFETRHGLFFSDEQMKNFSIGQVYHEKIKEYFVNYQIAESDNDKNRMVKYFRMSDRKVKVIYNGLDITAMRMYGLKPPKIKQEDNRLFRFLNVGRLTEQKSQLDLLCAVKILIQEFRNFHLTIYGEGEKEVELKKFILENKLETYVELNSYKNNIMKSLIDYDALVMTSKYEGVPYIVSASMAAGIPVIHTDVGGVSNIIDNNYEGLIVPVNDIVKLKNAMMKLATDNDLYNSVQANALKKIEFYTINRMVGEYMKLFEI